MAVTLFHTPEKVLNGITFRFVAVANPLPFKFQYSNTGNFSVNSYGILDNALFFETSNLVGNLEVGDFLKLTRISDGAEIVTSVTRIDTVNLRYFLNLDVNEGYATIINRWFEADYYLRVRLEVDGKIVATERVTPFTDGILKFYPQKYVENELNNIDVFDYTSIILKDENGALPFKIYYQEFEGGTAVGNEEETEEFIGVNSAKQIQEKNGANLGEQVLTQNSTFVLTKFKEPKIWAGYPFDISVLTKASTTPSTIETPAGSINLDAGLFDGLNRIAFNTSNLNGLKDGCITTGTEIPNVNYFVWDNFTCEVIPTVTVPPPQPPPPTPPPIPEPEPVPEFCGGNLGSAGGAAGIYDYVYQINYNGYIAILFQAYTFTDKAEIGKLQSDNLTVNILATTHMVNTDPSLDIHANSGLGVLGGNVNTLTFDSDGQRVLNEDAEGSGVEAGGCDAIAQYIGLAKLNPASGTGCTSQPAFPLRLNEYISETGDNDPPQIFGSAKLQYVWMPVSVGDKAVIRVSGRSGTIWNINNVFCHQTS